MKLVKHLANLGYGSRREMQALIRNGRVTDDEGNELEDDRLIAHERIRLDGKPLDPPAEAVILFHKPLGHTCSTRDIGPLIYDLLPRRWLVRKPVIAPIGRLDRDTSGLLLLTADGQYQHRVIAPKSKVAKLYEATLARPLAGTEQSVFASGTLMLESETHPLLPAEMTQTGPQSARLVLHEGRYHQVRRMFAAVGNHVETLHRAAIGALTLGDLPAGQWRVLTADEAALVFEPPVL